MIDCYIIDIDGTIADCEHRRHFLESSPKDWDAFFNGCKDDKPFPHMQRLIKVLAMDASIVYVSGRPARCKDDTLWWLKRHRFPSWPIATLYMRRDGDHRDDDILKLEMLAELRADGFEPIMAFDDRARVVRAWRSAGVHCAQVAEGEF